MKFLKQILSTVLYMVTHHKRSRCAPNSIDLIKLFVCHRMIFQKRNIYLHYENLKKEKMPDFLKKKDNTIRKIYRAFGSLDTNSVGIFYKSLPTAAFPSNFSISFCSWRQSYGTIWDIM